MSSTSLWTEYKLNALRHCPIEHPHRRDPAYAVIGLMGELGALFNVLKKHHWHGVSLGEEVLEKCGDVLWYCALLEEQGVVWFNADIDYTQRCRWHRCFDEADIKSALYESAQDLLVILCSLTQALALGVTYPGSVFLGEIHDILGHHDYTLADACSQTADNDNAALSELPSCALSALEGGIARLPRTDDGHAPDAGAEQSEISCSIKLSGDPQ